MLHSVHRLWIDGKNNVLADSGSRAPWEFVVAKHLPVPEQPIRDTIIKMFRDPKGLDKQVDKRKAEMGLGK